MSNLVPIFGRVIVKRATAPEKKGSIIVPEVAKEKPTEGVIVAKAEDVSDDLSPGTKVLFSKYAGQEVLVNDEPCLVLKAVDVIGFYKEP